MFLGLIMSDLKPMMPRYEAYKDSGVDWIGEIPEHWEEIALKFLLKERLKYGANESGVGYDPNLPRYIRITDFSESGKLNESSKLSLTWGMGKEYLLNDGDILFARSGATVGKSYQFSKKMSFEKFYAFAGYLIKATPNTEKILSDYLKYYSDSNSFKEWRGIIFNKATIENIGADKYSQLPVVLPTLGEQKNIANFLDCKTSKIDQAIAIKEKQINLLKERRQILIQTAVTQGLHPDAPMRDSGVKWIGKIPEHWHVKRAKYLFKEVDERSKTGKEELLSVSHMTGVTPRSEKNVNMFMAEDYKGSKTCQKNDLVFNIMWTWMGALGVSDRSGIVSSSYGIFRQQKEGQFNSRYLEYLLKTTRYIEHYNKISTGLHSSRLRFYGHMFFNMELGFPDKKEQDQIVSHINIQSTKIDKAITIQEQMIEKLKEYKTTLINSAVTGKIKVPMETK